MSMPKIPEESFRPSPEETIIDLLKSIAMEETAISHLMNAEAEKIQAFIGKDLDFPTLPSNQQILLFNQSINQLLEVLVMKEWLLLRKIDRVLQIALLQQQHEEE